MIMERGNAMPKLIETPVKARDGMFEDYHTAYSNRNSVPSQDLAGLKIRAAERSARRSLKNGKGNLGIEYEGLDNGATTPMTMSPNMLNINHSFDIAKTKLLINSIGHENQIASVNIHKPIKTYKPLVKQNSSGTLARQI